MLGTSPCDQMGANFDALFQSKQKTPKETEEEKRASAWGRDGCHGEYQSANHVVLTTHPRRGCPIKIQWGASNPALRGPVIASITQPKLKNAIGTHNGSYCVYRSIAVAAGKMDPMFRPDLHNTAPPVEIPPAPSWFDPTKIVSMDPWGHMITDAFGSHLKDGTDVRPTVAITKAHIQMPECREAMESGRLEADGKILLPDGSCVVTKAAIEHVWYLPGVAKRFNITEATLRRCMFEQTGGMFPELVTRPDLKLFLPPINGITVYMIGDVSTLSDPSKPVCVRLHDESYDSDVFATAASSCRSCLVYGMLESMLRSSRETVAGMMRMPSNRSAARPPLAEVAAAVAILPGGWESSVDERSGQLCYVHPGLQLKWHM